MLKMVQGHSGLGPETAMYHVTRILLSAREDIKYSPRAIILLIGMQIVDMKLLDEHLAKVRVDVLLCMVLFYSMIHYGCKWNDKYMYMYNMFMYVHVVALGTLDCNYSIGVYTCILISRRSRMDVTLSL